MRDSDLRNVPKPLSWKVNWPQLETVPLLKSLFAEVIIFVDKRAKEAKIIDIAIRGDARVKDKELEKIEKSQFLEKRNRKVVEGEVKVVPIVIEALGAVSDMFEKLNVAIRLEVIEKAALLGTAGLLRKV